MRFVSALLALMGVAALTVAVPPAVAGPVYTVSGGSFPNGDDQVTLTRPDGKSETGLAGQMSIQLLDTATGAIKLVQAYCTDIFDFLSLPATFTRGLLSDTMTDATRVSQINALITNGNPGVSSADSSAALQMAIWEIQNETNGTYDVTVGAFTVSGPTNAVALLANQDIKNVLTGVWKADPRFTIYQITGTTGTTNNQSLSYAEAVPEPATLAIFGTGLVLLLVLRRARRSTSVGPGGIAA